MSDLVKRLRQWNIAENATRTTHSIMRDLNDAADEIERLQSECDEHAAAYRRCSEERAKLQAEIERLQKRNALLEEVGDE